MGEGPKQQLFPSLELHAWAAELPFLILIKGAKDGEDNAEIRASLKPI